MKKKSKKEIKRRIEKYGRHRVCSKCGRIVYSKLAYSPFCLNCRDEEKWSKKF